MVHLKRVIAALFCITVLSVCVFGCRPSKSLDNQETKLEITYPAKDISVKTDVITVKGKTNPGITVSIQYQVLYPGVETPGAEKFKAFYPASDTQGRFSQAIPLEIGLNEISIYADSHRNSLDNSFKGSTTKKFTITRLAPSG